MGLVGIILELYGVKLGIRWMFGFLLWVERGKVGLSQELVRR